MNILDIALADYRGRWVVVYAYPRDDTPGCTKEACGFRDAKYRLPFTLLSDTDHRL